MYPQLETFSQLTRQYQQWMLSSFQLQTTLWQRWFEYLQAYGLPASAERTFDTVSKANRAVAEQAVAKVSELPPAPTMAAAAAPPEPAEKVEPKEAEPKKVEVVDSANSEDLTLINGIGPAIELKLIAAGIKTYRQIANWTDADIERIEQDVIGSRFSGRIRRDDWRTQARSLMG